MASRIPIKIGAIKLRDFTALAGSSFLYLSFALITSSIVGVIAYNGYVMGTYIGEGRGQMFYWIMWNAIAMGLIYVTLLYGTFQVMSSSNPRDVLKLIRRYSGELTRSGVLCVLLGLITGLGLATLYMDSSEFSDRQRVIVAYATLMTAVISSVFSTIRSYTKFGGRSRQDVYDDAVGRIDISASGRPWDRLVSASKRIHLIHLTVSVYVLFIGVGIGAYFTGGSEALTGFLITFTVVLCQMLFLVCAKLYDIVFRRQRLLRGEKYSPRGIEFFDERADEDCVGSVLTFNMERRKVLRAKEEFNREATA